jgi:hypothetical protein
LWGAEDAALLLEVKLLRAKLAAAQAEVATLRSRLCETEQSLSAAVVGPCEHRTRQAQYIRKKAADLLSDLVLTADEARTWATVASLVEGDPSWWEK